MFQEIEPQNTKVAQESRKKCKRLKENKQNENYKMNSQGSIVLMLNELLFNSQLYPVGVVAFRSVLLYFYIRNQYFPFK